MIAYFCELASLDNLLADYCSAIGVFEFLESAQGSVTVPDFWETVHFGCDNGVAICCASLTMVCLPKAHAFRKYLELIKTGFQSITDYFHVYKQ